MEPANCITVTRSGLVKAGSRPASARQLPLHVALSPPMRPSIRSNGPAWQQRMGIHTRGAPHAVSKPRQPEVDSMLLCPAGLCTRLGQDLWATVCPGSRAYDEPEGFAAQAGVAVQQYWWSSCIVSSYIRLCMAAATSHNQPLYGLHCFHQVFGWLGTL